MTTMTAPLDQEQARKHAYAFCENQSVALLETIFKDYKIHNETLTQLIQRDEHLQTEAVNVALWRGELTLTSIWMAAANGWLIAKRGLTEQDLRKMLVDRKFDVERLTKALKAAKQGVKNLESHVEAASKKARA